MRLCRRFVGLPAAAPRAPPQRALSLVGGHYKSASILKDGVLVGITPENPDPAAVEAAFVFGRLSQTLERTQKTIRPQSERLLG
jgi:hypothetical protein